MPVRSAGAARALVVLASVAMVLAIVAGYARRAVVDSDQFSNRATVALSDPSVRTLIADKITDEVVLKNESDLLAARPIIQSVASGCGRQQRVREPVPLGRPRRGSGAVRPRREHRDPHRGRRRHRPGGGAR